MTPEHYRRASQLFLAACALDREARASFLQRECRGDHVLRAEVESLLESDAEEAEFVDAAAAGGGAELLAQDVALLAEQLPAAEIAGFTLVRKIGEGGMGSVWEARQSVPRRTVALKLIRGIGSGHAARRFEREAELLGRLHHPGIAHVYQAGVASVRSPAGENVQQHYLAMELIDGEPLDRHADLVQLDVRGRLELVAKIADTVQHAHQHGIVHRDLKPSNILVDRSGQPRLLDFGIARSLDADADADGTCTLTGQLLGTPAYMSPEQVGRHPEAVDARSDVYALGVLTYQLLTGNLPHAVDHLPLLEAVSVIRDHPAPPLRSSLRQFDADVEIIVAKAMRKDREARYASAASFADDIRRYLAHEPIVARPPSSIYRLRLFARRHKAVMATLVTLAAGLVVSSVLALQAARDRDAARAAERRAETEANTAKAINAFWLHDVLLKASPRVANGEKYTLEQVADDAGQAIARSLATEPAVAAAIEATLGDIHLQMGRAATAEVHLRRALELQRSSGIERPEERTGTVRMLAESLRNQDRLDDAESMLRELLASQVAQGDDQSARAPTIEVLAGVLYQRRDLDQARALFEQALAIDRRAATGDSQDVARCLLNLGEVAYTNAEFARGEELMNEALAMQVRLFGAESYEVIAAMVALAELQAASGKHDAARAQLTATLAVQRKVVGERHPSVARTLWLFADEHLARGEAKEANELLDEALSIQREMLQPGHRDLGDTLCRLARARELQGDLAGAERHLREALDVFERKNGKDSQQVATTCGNLARILLDEGQRESARDVAEKAVDTWREASGPASDEMLGRLLLMLGQCAIATGDHDRAEEVLLEAHERLERALGARDATTRTVIDALIKTYQATGREEEARQWRARQSP